MYLSPTDEFRQNRFPILWYVGGAGDGARGAVVTGGFNLG